MLWEFGPIPSCMGKLDLMGVIFTGDVWPDKPPWVLSIGCTWAASNPWNHTWLVPWCSSLLKWGSNSVNSFGLPCEYSALILICLLINHTWPQSDSFIRYIFGLQFIEFFEGLGNIVFLEEGCHWGSGFSIIPISFCLLLMDKDIHSQILLQGYA